MEQWEGRGRAVRGRGGAERRERWGRVERGEGEAEGGREGETEGGRKGGREGEAEGGEGCETINTQSIVFICFSCSSLSFRCHANRNQTWVFHSPGDPSVQALPELHFLLSANRT